MPRPFANSITDLSTTTFRGDTKKPEHRPARTYLRYSVVKQEESASIENSYYKHSINVFGFLEVSTLIEK